jgi:hypothetical protein
MDVAYQTDCHFVLLDEEEEAMATRFARQSSVMLPIDLSILELLIRNFENDSLLKEDHL